MAGNWYIVVPEASTNKVKNPSAEAEGNTGLLVGSPSASPSSSASGSPSASASPSASVSASPSASISTSPSKSASPSASISKSPSASVSPSSSVSPSVSPSAGATLVSRDTTQAKAGDYCFHVYLGAAFDGITWTLEALTNAAHYVSFYVYGTVAGTLQVALDGNSFFSAAVIGGATGGWVRYGAAVTAASANGSTALSIRSTSAEDLRFDCLQVEANSYGTTYIDGDAGPLYRWNGLRHASSSTRDPQERSGGRIRNLEDDYSVQVMDGSQRLGLPPIVNNLQATALQPGAAYQGYKILPREIELRLRVAASDQTTNALAIANFHSLRRALIDLVMPDKVRGAQPFVLGYAGADSGTVLWASFYYVSGLEFGADLLAYDEISTVRFLATDPYWYEDNRATAVLDYSDSLTTAYAARRINGAWSALGSGFDGRIQCIAVDTERGRVYFGGDFSTANGVTVNRVCYWDGTTFVAMGATPGTSGGSSVNALAIASNGDVWVGGNFTSAGGATADGLARWNVATNSWTRFTNGTPGDQIYALAIDNSGNVYGGGSFLNWDGVANEDYIWKYNGSVFSALGTGMGSVVRAITVHPDGKVYVGGVFTTGDGVTLNGLGYWNGTTFVAMGATAGVSGSSATVLAIVVLRNGNLAIGGDFTSAGGSSGFNYVAGWNGSTFTLLSTGMDAAVYSLAELANGTVAAGGFFTTAGGLALTDRLALWNGYVWTALDLDLPGTPITYGLAVLGGTLYIGTDTSGTATASGITTVTNAGLSDCFPEVTIIGPSSSTATLQWLENQSTDETLFFNLTINILETLGISFQPGDKSVRTIWSGRPVSRVVNLLNFRGRITGFTTLVQGAASRYPGLIRGQPLPGSDFAAFHLGPGSNTLACFITGTTTGVVALLHYVPRHLSVDGGA